MPCRTLNLYFHGWVGGWVAGVAGWLDHLETMLKVSLKYLWGGATSSSVQPQDFCAACENYHLEIVLKLKLRDFETSVQPVRRGLSSALALIQETYWQPTACESLD